MSFETLNEEEWQQVDGIWDLLQQGELATARGRFRQLHPRRPGHPDLKVLDAALSLEESRPQRALEVLKGAEQSADPALFFQLRAAALFQLVRFEEAHADAERALAIRPDLAETHDLLSRLYEHLGDHERAHEHATEAQALDPEAFPAPLEVSNTDFDELVENSLREIPPRVRQALDELPVVVQPLPALSILTAEQPPLSPDLLGLFVGHHLLERTSGESGGLPGAIYLFRRNLLRMCTDREALAREVRTTVQHEIGHLLGLDEDDLEQWGLA